MVSSVLSVLWTKHGNPMPGKDGLYIETGSCSLLFFVGIIIPCNATEQILQWVVGLILYLGYYSGTPHQRKRALLTNIITWCEWSESVVWSPLLIKWFGILPEWMSVWASCRQLLAGWCPLRRPARCSKEFTVEGGVICSLEMMPWINVTICTRICIIWLCK